MPATDWRAEAFGSRDSKCRKDALASFSTPGCYNDPKLLKKTCLEVSETSFDVKKSDEIPEIVTNIPTLVTESPKIVAKPPKIVTNFLNKI